MSAFWRGALLGCLSVLALAIVAGSVWLIAAGLLLAVLPIGVVLALIGVVVWLGHDLGETQPKAGDSVGAGSSAGDGGF